MQPEWVIDNLMNAPEKRKSATNTVRGLLRDYDDAEISPDLSNFGAPGASENRQLALKDENKTSECP
jgi:FPC/CPF motif-containing protein YcgG